MMARHGGEDEDLRVLAKSYVARAIEKVQKAGDASPLEVARIYTDIAQVCASLAIAEAVGAVDGRMAESSERVLTEGLPVYGTIRTKQVNNL
ncbi:hypothetical protein D5H75_09540 [Bailinhaonella thermotolerans]|uniref:Uncharacterized protein n=2 Tax=Bailinhaonella thermotolerans TaxID=1070861 RepID=A0A3A4B6D8_9ACTN|nr:hypothetical protein D5H75_09540 [Bailinhaonella thermotolerans]